MPDYFYLWESIYDCMELSREAILKAIKRTVVSVEPDATVILFGSQARGDATADSDWDILILLDKQRIENADFDRIAYPLYELGWEQGEQFSPKLYTWEEWRKRSFTLFYKNIEQEGIVL